MDEDDSEWVVNEKDIAIIITVPQKCPSKYLRCSKLKSFFRNEKDALMHRAGLKGWVYSGQ